MGNLGLSSKDWETLDKKAKKLRVDIFDYSRRYGAYHFGGALSCVEILVSLYSKVLTEEDRFILSKGHASMALYPLLVEKGFDPKCSEHPDMDIKNGLWCTTGSLGMGLPIGIGIAKAKKIKETNGRIYVLMGEAELQEGTTWESLLIARQHKLDNLIGIIDLNNCQGSGWVNEILSLGDVKKKLEAFDSNVLEIDGHSFKEILQAVSGLKENGKCTMIIANTVKGKGAKVMEKDPDQWHAKFPTPDQMEMIYRDFGCEMR